MIYDEPMDVYHASDHVSHSKLRDFAKRGPKYYWLRYVGQKINGGDTAAFQFGRAFEHFLIGNKDGLALTPEDHNGRTKAGKEWVKEQRAAGREILSPEDSRAMEWMKRAIDEHDTAKALLEGAAPQVTIRMPFAPLPGVQTRPDWINLEGSPASNFQPYALDLKTTGNLDEIVSNRSIVRYGYHAQAALFRLLAAYHGVKDLACYLLVSEKAFPHRCVVVELTADYLDVGERWVLDQLQALGDHYEADYWPLTTGDVVTLGPPEWAQT